MMSGKLVFLLKILKTDNLDSYRNWHGKTRTMCFVTTTKKGLSRLDDSDVASCSGEDQEDPGGTVCQKEEDVRVVQVDVTIEETRR